MEKNIISGLLCLLAIAATAQDVSYEVRGRYSRPVTKENLDKANVISDFIPGYPTNWITEYVSVEVLASGNGKSQKATGVNDILNPAQKNILHQVDLASDIFITVNYKNVNPVTKKPEERRMDIKVTVIPEIEAEYAEGKEQLEKYLKKNIMNEISETVLEYLQLTKVIFIVNDEGAVVNTRISATSGDSNTDRLIIEAINKMPTWKPAKNSKGVKVSQEFEFSIGRRGC